MIGWLRSLRAVVTLAALIPAAAETPSTPLGALAPAEVWVDGFAMVNGIAFDEDDRLYVADAQKGTLTRITADRQRIVLASGLDRPMALALDADGGVLVAEDGAGRVVRLDPGGGRTTLLAGLFHPRALALAPDGTVFVSTGEPSRIVALRPDGGLAVLAAGFKELQALVFDDDVLFVAAKGRVDESDVQGAVYAVAVRADGSAGAIARHGPTDVFDKPLGLARDRLDAFYLTTKSLDGPKPRSKDALAKLHPGGTVTRFAADLADPRAVALDSQGNLYVADGAAGRVWRFRAPLAPTLAPLAAFTSASTVTVAGTTEPDARVDLFVDDLGGAVTGSADPSGAFALVTDLAADTKNALAVFATPHAGHGLTSPPAEATVIHDASAPAIAVVRPDAGAFVRRTVTVEARANDGGSGVADVALEANGTPLTATLAPSPPATAVVATAAWDSTTVADGTQTLTARSLDRAGNRASVPRLVVVDNTPPETDITGGPSGDTAETSVTFTFSGADNLTPKPNLVFAWRLDGGAFTSFSSATSASFADLGEGPHTFEVTTRDLAGNEDPTPAVRSFTVTRGPAITALEPSSGPVGTLVRLAGGGFAPEGTQIAFDGVPAVIRSLTPTEILAIVPFDARTGPVTVTTARGTATSAVAFTVTTVEDFALLVAPASIQLLPGTTASLTVRLNATSSAPLTSLTTLSVSGLPSGVSAAFLPAATTSGGQLRTLTLVAAPSAAPGTVTATITADTLIDGRPVRRSADTTLTVTAGGRTAALGRVTIVDGTPIAGVRLTLGGTSATTDEAGNFQLVDVPAGTQMLGVDANAARAGLPIYGVEVQLVAGQPTELAPFRIMPPPPPERFTPIANAAADQVITDPRFPGLALTLPAGVTITGWDGSAKTRIALERLSPESLPVPPPPGPTRSLYQVFFGTPMGGLPSAPLPIALPNDQNLEPGQAAEIWYYDAAPIPGAPAGWRLAGLGTVSADGSRVVSNPGVGLARFCGVCGTMCIVNKTDNQSSINPLGETAGEPVDLGTGLMLVDKVDLILPGRVPAVLRRTHNAQDPFGRVAGFELATGPGWTLSIDVVLLEVSGTARRLILPGNARFTFTAAPDGTFRNETFPDFAGAVLRRLIDGTHTLRFKDGTTWRFATGYVPRVGLPIAIGGLGLLVAQTDRHGNDLTIVRDRFGAPTRIVEPGGRALELTVDVGGRLVSVADPIGRVVRYGYGAAAPFRLETVTDPAGGVTRYGYDATGNLVTITDARGITFLTNEFDVAGRVVRQTQADGGVWGFAYGGPVGAHTSATVTDPRGHVTVHRLDNAGFDVEVVDALGQRTRYDRDAAGRVVVRTDPLGRVTSFAYDQAGNVTRVTDPAGHVRTFTYEPTFNRVTSAVDPLGQLTRFEYDAAGNLTAVVDPTGHRTSYAYDGAGQPIAVTDAVGNVTRFEYDAFGNLTATVDPLGHRIRREYDPASRLVRRTNALGQSTSMGWDALNRVETVLDGRGGVTRFGYDPNGNLLTVTDARGGVTAHSYDAMDRLASRTDPVGATESFTYDGLGNLTRHVDRKGQVATFAYDPLNRRTRAVYPDATVELVYDAVGRLVEASDSAGGTVLHGYDVLDRSIAQTSDLGRVTYDYDPLGRRTAMAAPGQAPVSYGYDAASRLTSVAQAGVRVELAYDAAGRRTRLGLPNQVATEYAYDSASRLTRLLYRGGAGVLGDLTYEYDADGNRIGLGGSLARTLLPDPITAASYDVANRQLTFGPRTLSYDRNGNLTNDGATAYAWDSRNRLLGLAGDAGTAAFAYDALGRRSRKTIHGIDTRVLHDGLNPIQLVPNTGVPLSLLTGLGIDEFFVSTQGTEQRTLLADALGSTIAEIDGASALVAEYAYEPYGRTAVTGVTANPFRYTGRENDGTGLYYYRARHYHPSLHRFVSEDPLPVRFRARTELNPYPYAGNNPILFSDPLGLFTLPKTNYCGPGGGGQILNEVDYCCLEHDHCYGRSGIDALMNVIGPPRSVAPCRDRCDEELCDCLAGTNPRSVWLRLSRSVARWQFGCARNGSRKVAVLWLTP